MTPRALMKVRIAAALAGLLFLLVAILADPLGLSRQGGTGEGQVLAGVLGAVLMTAGAAGRRFIEIWRWFGLLVLGAVCLLLLFGTTRTLIAALKPSPPYDRSLVLKEEIISQPGSVLLFSPHVLWVSAKTSSDDSPDLVDDVSNVIWLYGYVDPPEDGNGFNESIPQDAVVVDRRQPMYNSTQALILLMTHLRSEEAPDRVLLIAGKYDLEGAEASGDPRWPVAAMEFGRQLNCRYDLSLNLTGEAMTEGLERLRTVNLRILEALGREYGFQAEMQWEVPAE